MAFSERIGSRTFGFADLATLMARASPERSGDRLAGIAAESAVERMAARMCLARVPIDDRHPALARLRQLPYSS